MEYPLHSLKQPFNLNTLLTLTDSYRPESSRWAVFPGNSLLYFLDFIF